MITATIGMIWNTDPMKMTASFCVSPTPAQNEQRDERRGRQIPAERPERLEGLVGLNAPIAMPSGTATIAARTNPPTTRNTVMPTSRRKPNSVKSP